MSNLIPRKGALGACLLACSLLAAACGDLPTARDASALSPDGIGPRNAVYVTTGTVTRVVLNFTSGAIDRTTWTLPIGGSEQITAVAYDSANRVITGRAVRYVSSSPARLAIDSATGLATGLTQGTVYVSAIIDGVTGKTGNFTVKAVTTSSTPTSPLPPSVKSVTVRQLSGAMDTTAWTLAVGASEQFAATAYDSAGTALTGVTPVYKSSNAAAVTVDSVTGAAQAVAPGSATISATVSGVTGTTRAITVPAPAPTQPPPAAGASSINVTVTRFDGQTGAATVSSGIPLVAGMLRPGQEGMVRVTMGGAEQAVYVTGLASLHPDGSLRAVLVQFNVASLGAAQTGRIDFTTSRPASMTLAAPLMKPGTPVAGTPAGLPQAAVLPTDPSYLLATDLVGPTTTVAANAALGGTFARYESDWTTYANKHWAAEGARWDGNYYDRALIYYAWWARTGNPTYWARAGQIALGYRVNYLELNAYGSSPHWSQLEGLEKHFLLTGDDSSRVAVVKTANRLYGGYINSNYMTRTSGESRIAARVLHGALLAWRLAPAGWTPVLGLTSTTWGTRVETAIGKIVAWQQANGSFPADGQVCGGQLNYMIGLQNDALIKTYDYYVPAATSRATLQGQIKTVVTKAIDYLWTTQWIPSSSAFKYASVNCTGIGGTTAAPDLNNLIVAGFGWLYQTTGDATYRTRGDVIFNQGVLKAYLVASKQFNEAYTSSFRYLGYR